MSPRSVEEIVADYFTAVSQGALTGQLNTARLHFADDIRIMGAHKEIQGKPQVFKYMQEKLIPHLEKVTIHHQLADKNTNCSIVTFVTKTPHEPVPAALYFRVKNGVIFEIQFFYDPERWAKGIGMRRAG